MECRQENYVNKIEVTEGISVLNAGLDALIDLNYS
jgi:hypothetical protein